LDAKKETNFNELKLEDLVFLKNFI
jgi:hypothetical protein